MSSSLQRCLLALALGSFPALVLGQPRPDPREVAREVHAQGGYVGELRFRGRDGTVGSFPVAPHARPGSTEGGRRFDTGPGEGAPSERVPGRGGEAAPPSRELRSFPDSFFAGLAVSRVLLGVVAVLLLGLFVAVAMTLRRPNPPSPPRRPRTAPSTRPADELPDELADPDALAAEGRYAEAIAALLAQALASVGWQPAQERARTAREVLGALPSGDARRPPLAQVVRLAERVRFAGDTATDTLFAEAKRWYEALVGEGRETHS